MILLTDFIDWLKTQLGAPYSGWRIVPGTDFPEGPDPGAAIQRLEGGGLTFEDLLDGFGFQVEVAGKQNDYASAEAFAYAIDAVILGPGGSRQVAGTWCSSAQRFSGGPAALETDDAERHHLVASYLLDVGSGLV